MPKSYQVFFEIRSQHDFLEPHFVYRYNRYNKKLIQNIYFYPKFIVFDLLNTSIEIIEIINKKNFIQLGGNRNLFYGVVKLKDYISIDIADLELPSNASHAILISPALSIPDYFESYKCRWSDEILWNNGVKKRIRIIPLGQFFRIKKNGDRKKIALDGIISRDNNGYGEFLLHDWKN